MHVGYARVSKADGSQSLDLQRDALLEAAVSNTHIYEDLSSGKKDERPGLDACLKALRAGDTLVVWKLDRLGRSLTHLVNLIDDLQKRKIGVGFGRRVQQVSKEEFSKTKRHVAPSALLSICRPVDHPCSLSKTDP
jgi:DNA invertase Pin-like site-specific DNA recombinase